MSLFGQRRREAVSNVDGPLIPSRGSGRKGAVAVNDESALRLSAVWACLMLRAGLVSTFPVDVFRKVGDIQVEVPKPPILVNPDGEDWPWGDWIHATEVDLGRAGNTIGLITERNALGLPSRIELQPINSCAVIKRRATTHKEYRIDGKIYQPEQVWHERQYVVSGLPVGLSPVAYAAATIGEYLSMQDFALDWFGGSAIPKARLKNTDRKVVDPKEAGVIRDRWQATISNGDLFVHGSAWEYDLMQAEAVGMEWLEGRRFGLTEISRFFQCPADLIDAAISAPGTLTYASMTERNLQYLIMQLGPAVTRRETKLSTLLPKPRFIKLTTDALLRMDPAKQIKVLAEEIKARIRTVTEARALRNLPPLTPAQEEEFTRLFGAPRTQPTTATSGVAAVSDEQRFYEQVSPLSVVPYAASEAEGWTP